MHFTTLLTYAAVAGTTGMASYVLEDDYMANGNFFDMFSFWDQADPTNGFVAYQSQSDAQNQGLISSSPNNIKMSVDSTNVTPNGRPSVRITSNKSYDSGLVILDLEHMPGGICGTWPAFWMVGPDWPNQGEIDIVEGVNDQTSNAMTLHTGPGCSINSNAKFSGTISTSNCDVNAPGQDQNAGCGIRTTDDQSYGTGFNSNGGGVYATEWTSSCINMYFFPRGSVPSDISSGSPDPAKWGEPYAKFEGSCDFSTKFTNQQIVFDTTFCGDWAGDVWSSSSCASKADTCNAFVQNTPSAFVDAYWSVNGLKVYSNNGGSSPSSAAPAPSSAPGSVSVGQPSGIPGSTPVSSWGQPSAAPSQPSAAPSQPSAAPSNGGGSSFVTVPTGSAPAPAPSASGSGAPWAPTVGSSGVVQGPTSAAPAPTSPAEPSGAPSGGWPGATQTGSQSWGNHPWPSGGWMEHENKKGAYAVGVPVQGDSRRHARHLRHLGHHKLHAAGRL